MAFPLASAQSPTGFTPLLSPQIPKKRTNDLTLAPLAPHKRRKMSNLSQGSAPPTAHPLRQTSFPLDPVSPFIRSPSVDTLSHVSGSQVSALAFAQPRKKRGRKAKAATDASSKEPTASVAGGPTIAGGPTGGDRAAAAGEEDDDDDGPSNVAVDSVLRTQEQKQEESRLRAMLVQAFDPTQYHRYELWRAARLSDSVVKRVINATVSQSVPQTVVLAVKSVSKLFAGQIIDVARAVQAEWIAAGETQIDIPTPPELADEKNAVGALSRKGPLRPEHFREAWRRYRVMGKGGGVGLHFLWHAQQSSGVERFAVKTGKRLFR